MKPKALILLFIISLGINVGLIARLVWQRPTPKGIEESYIRHGWRRGGLRHRLNLDENQLKRIEAIHESTFARMNLLRETLKLKRRELIEILREEQVDKSRIEALIKEIANRQAEIELGFTENILMIKKVLKPEQQQVFFELFRERFGDRERGRFPPFSPKHLRHRRRYGPK